MIKYIHSQFIATKINGKEGKGKEYRKEYEVKGYPTVLLLNPDGTEIDRLFGWNGDKEKYFKILMDYANNKNTIGDLTNRQEQAPDDVEVNYLLAKRRADRYEMQLANPYFENILRLDPDDKFGYQMESKTNLAIFQLQSEGDDKPLQEILANSEDQDQLNRGFNDLIRYHRRNDNQEAVLKTYDKALKKLEASAGFLNGYGWYIYESRIKDRYDHAIKLTKKAIEMQSDAHSIWDTLSWLEFEAGQIDKAIEHMEKCLELDPTSDYYLKNVQKMKEAKTGGKKIS